MKEINPVTMSKQEYVELIVDENNYANKVNELNNLLKEINAKIAIANTVRMADKLNSQAKALMRQVKADQQRINNNELDQKKRFKEQEKKLQERFSQVERNESDYFNRLNMIVTDEENLESQKRKFEREKATFKSDQVKDLALCNEKMSLLAIKTKRLSEIFNHAIDEANSL